MSKTPVVTSGDVNVRVASHLSNLPAIATEALTENVIELPSCVITKVGACARLGGVSTADAARQKTAIRIVTECDLSLLGCQMKTQRSNLSAETSSGTFACNQLS